MPDRFKPGDFREIQRTFSIEDVKAFALLTGDFNPIHLDAEYAKKTFFGQPIVHGMLVSSLFSALIANELPGEGSIYLHQDLDFKAPVYIGMPVTSRVTIQSIKENKPIYELVTTCYDEHGKVLIEGSATILKKES